MDEARGKLAALGIEMDATMKRFCGDTDLLVEMLREFAAEDLLERLPAAIAESDGAAIERAAHAVKGTSANLGLHGAEVRAATRWSRRRVRASSTASRGWARRRWRATGTFARASPLSDMMESSVRLFDRG